MNPLTKDEILELIPQQSPFRFIDKIIELNEESIVATYTYKHSESFYAGHFPDNPVTPGVILLETLAQTGIVAFGLYLASKKFTNDENRSFLALFAEANVEFIRIVRPGDRVTIRAKKLFFRRLKIKVEAELMLANGKIACRGTIAGIGVNSIAK